MPNVLPSNIPKVVDFLKARGQQGASSSEIRNALGLGDHAVSNSTYRALERGLVEWWPHPMGRSMNRRRWYAAGMRPEKPPAPEPFWRPEPEKREPNGVRRYVGRFHVELPAGYTSALSASECRPWAAAAAGARG